MPLEIELYKGDDLIFKRGSCERCGSSSPKAVENGEYKLVIKMPGSQSGNVKEFVEFVKKAFSLDPLSVMNIEELFFEYIKTSVGSSRPKDVISKVLNRIKNITGGVSALVLKPFILIRSSSVPSGTLKPYESTLENIVAIPKEEYVRYVSPFKTEDIDSELMYLCVSDLLSRDFYEKIHAYLSSLDGFDREISEIVYNASKKNQKLVNVFEAVRLKLEEVLNSIPEIERAAVETHRRRETKPFIIRNGKLVPLFRIKINIIQMPPALGKSQIEEATRKAVYETARKVISEVFKIPNIDEYFDLSEIEVYLNIRSFCTS